MRCINGFLAVYRHDPHGPWAAAGLYHAGVMYYDLYQHSFLQADKQESIELLNRVERYFSSSRYKPRAQAELAKITGKSVKEKPAANGPTPVQWYQKAQAKYQRLKQDTNLQKYRDQWQACITYYRKAYEADPFGDLAAAALFGMAGSYRGLYKWSRKTSDLRAADDALEKLVATFPTSPYAVQAKATIDEKNPSTADMADSIAQVIENTARAPLETPRDAASIDSKSLSVVEGLRFWSNPRYTRVVIDADQNTAFSYRELREDPSIGKPQRIYIDVKKSRLSNSLQRVVPINDNLLSDARAGQYAPDTVRVVVDIKSAKTFKIFPLKNPFRIVLDVWGYDGESSAGVATTQSPAIDDPGAKLPPSAIIKQLALGVRRVVIDPGHGGKDSGAPGYYKGVYEKDIVLSIGKRLGEMIRRELNCQVVMTRDSDTYLSLEERTAIANTQNADLFISIHTNASPNKRAYGLETFILNLATDDESIRVAAMENATSMKNISDLDSILKDLMQNAKVNESTRLATYVQQATYRCLSKKHDHIRNKGVKKAPFYVLLGADMPSILVETSFISNPRECKRLTSVAYQDLLCRGIVEGIKHYVDETNPIAFRSPQPGLEARGGGG